LDLSDEEKQATTVKREAARLAKMPHAKAAARLNEMSPTKAKVLVHDLADGSRKKLAAQGPALNEAMGNVSEAMNQLQEFEEILDALVDVGRIGGVAKASKRFLNPLRQRVDAQPLLNANQRSARRDRRDSWMVEVGEQVGPTKMRRRQSSVAVDIAKERNRNFYSQYKSGDQMVKMRAEQVKQAREKVGTYTSRDGKSQKVDVSHIQSTNRRLKQQQIDMQEKARKEKEETTQKERLRKAELQMYKDEAVAVESWLLECKMEKIAKRYADKMIMELIRTPFKSVGPYNLPTTKAAYDSLVKQLPRSPYAACYLFLIGLAVRSFVSKSVGDDILHDALSPACIRPLMHEECDRLSRRGTSNPQQRAQKMSKLLANPPLRMRGHTKKHVALVTPTMVQRLFVGGAAGGDGSRPPNATTYHVDPLKDALTAKCRVSFDSDGTGNYAQYRNKDKAIYLCNLVCEAPLHWEEKVHPHQVGAGEGALLQGLRESPTFFRDSFEANVKCEFNAARDRWGVRSWSNFPADPEGEKRKSSAVVDPSISEYVAPMASDWHRSEHKAMQMKKIVV